MAKKDDNLIGKIVLTYTKGETGDVTTELTVKGFDEDVKKAKSEDKDTKLEGVSNLAIAYELGTVAMFRTLNIKGKDLKNFLQNVFLPSISEDA